MPRDLTAAAQMHQHDNRMTAWQMRAAGHTYSQIAAKLGVSVSWAYKLVTNALKDREDEPAALVLAQQVEVLDLAVRSVVAILAGAANDPKLRLDAIDRLLRLSERRCKMLGIDIPARQQDPADPYERAEQELQDFIRDGKRPADESAGLKSEAGF
jgi:hypothetical protein